MAKMWKRMTTEERQARLRHEDQSTRQLIAGISARLDELGAVVIELENQLKELQGEIARQKGRPRPVIKASAISSQSN